MDTAVWYIRESFRMNGTVVLEKLWSSDGSTRVYTADDEDIRSSGLVQVSDGLYTPKCRCGVQVDR
jgi:hypothetical protein